MRTCRKLAFGLFAASIRDSGLAGGKPESISFRQTCSVLSDQIPFSIALGSGLPWVSGNGFPFASRITLKRSSNLIGRQLPAEYSERIRAALYSPIWLGSVHSGHLERPASVPLPSQGHEKVDAQLKLPTVSSWNLANLTRGGYGHQPEGDLELPDIAKWSAVRPR
ncbi:uncharacterized protein BDV17DRAFT_136222 [Aspergillus undulatus]|uniref:uncharacterized protein n=1 Tax=Aspergillus undulatus TaxID=1810928 RepID=UPI003CCDDD83